MNATEARAWLDRLDGAVRDASRCLRAIPGVGKGPMGLTPDSAKTPAYRAAKQHFDLCSKVRRDFYVALSPKIKRELNNLSRQDRDAKRANK
jgi:hypothetical protein